MNRHNLKGREFWGPSVWRTLHSFAAAYTADKKESALVFVYSLPHLLPCEICRAHLVQNLQRMPPENYMKDNHTFFFWTYALHDVVNQQINAANPGLRRKISPPIEIVKNEYFHALADDCRACKL